MRTFLIVSLSCWNDLPLKHSLWNYLSVQVFWIQQFSALLWVKFMENVFNISKCPSAFSILKSFLRWKTDPEYITRKSFSSSEVQVNTRLMCSMTCQSWAVQHSYVNVYYIKRKKRLYKNKENYQKMKFYCLSHFEKLDFFLQQNVNKKPFISYLFKVKLSQNIQGLSSCQTKVICVMSTRAVTDSEKSDCSHATVHNQHVT